MLIGQTWRLPAISETGALMCQQHERGKWRKCAKRKGKETPVGPSDDATGRI